MADPAKKLLEEAPAATARALICAVDEVLGAFASASVRMKVIDRALTLGGYSSLPTEPEAFEQFMSGPLPDAIDMLLGPATSGVVIEQLRPLVRRALAKPSPTTSGLIRSPASRATTIAALKRQLTQPPEARPTMRVDPMTARAVAVSPDAEARLRLVAALGPNALAVASLHALWDALAALGDERTVVIVDLRLTRVDRAQLAELGERGPLVLWGGRGDLPGAVPCAGRETPEQVASLVLQLRDQR